MAEDTFEVTVRGSGDPEVFVAHKVEIVVNGREHFVITPGMFGLVIRSPVKQPLFLGAVSVDTETVKIRVYKIGP